MPEPGRFNLLSDVPGLLVGHETDEQAATGVTVVECAYPMTAAIDVRGGGPGTRETDLLSDANLVQQVHAIVLAGGSVFGLAAADGVASELSAKGVGLRLSDEGFAIPIVPCAVLYDLEHGGDKNWRNQPPYEKLGRAALGATSQQFALGAVGAGRGARAGLVDGGVGSASIDLDADGIVGALAVVNSVGSTMLPDGKTYYAHAYELNNEFGGQAAPGNLQLADPFPESARIRQDGRLQAGANTTLCVVATSIELTRSELKRVAMMAHDGLARAVRPAHLPFDGDLVFALSSAQSGVSDSVDRNIVLSRIGSAAADCLARAITRGVYEANPKPG